MHYVIVGNSVAAAGAIEGIRRIDQDSDITIFSDERFHIYSRPLISYYLAGKVTAEQMKYRPDDFYQQHKVKARLGEKVERIEFIDKQVLLENGVKVPYDKLLIATGGRPIMPPIIGLEKENVHKFIKWGEVQEIKEKIVAGKQVVIIGAGLIGLKAAEGLVGAGCQVTVVDLADRVLSAILDQQAGAIVQKHLEEQQIQFHLENTVDEVLGDNQVTGVRLKDGTELPCDLLIVAIGVVPNLEVLGTDSSVAVNRGILVNRQVETSIAGVYAAGDVAEGLELLSAEQRVLPILPNAYLQGEVAGMNMAGKEVQFVGGIAMNAIGFFGLPMLTGGYASAQGDTGWEELVLVDEQQQVLKKLVLEQNRLKGFIFINQVDRAGIYNWLLEEQIDITSFKEKLLQEDFGYIHLPEELRHRKLVEGGVA